MLEIIMVLFTVYTLIKIYISVMQIGYIATEKNGDAILMSQEKYHVAGEYAIKKELIEANRLIEVEREKAERLLHNIHLILYHICIQFQLVGIVRLYQYRPVYHKNMSILQFDRMHPVQ